MKLRFLMSRRRKDSVRDKVIGKKWIYLERNTLHRCSVGHLRRRERPPAVILMKDAKWESNIYILERSCRWFPGE